MCRNEAKRLQYLLPYSRTVRSIAYGALGCLGLEKLTKAVRTRFLHILPTLFQSTSVLYSPTAMLVLQSTAPYFWSRAGDILRESSGYAVVLTIASV